MNQTATIGPAIRILADKSFSIPNKGVSVCTNPNNIINRQIIPPAYPKAHDFPDKLPICSFLAKDGSNELYTMPPSSNATLEIITKIQTKKIDSGTG